MSPDKLERELRAALAASPPAEPTERLVAWWERASRAERRRRRRVRVAVAASLAAAVIASAWLIRTQHAPPLIADNERPLPDREAQSAPAVVQPTAPKVIDPRSAGRAPTAYEQAMFAAATRMAIDPHVSELAAEVDRLIELLAADPTARADQLAQAADLSARGAEALLLRRLPRARGPHAKAVVRLLAACGGPRSAPAILNAARSDELRGEALGALEQLVGMEGLAQAVPLAPDRRVRLALLDRLLTADSPAALRSFLALASSRAYRADALDAAAACRQFPVEPLLAALEDDERQVRLGAALVLGHVDGPEVARSLMALATRRNDAPVEAWVALLACRDPAADQFLARASLHPHLLGQVNRARTVWARFIP